MRVFEFTDYKQFVKHRIESMPHKGHGQYRKLAMHLNVSSVQISHVFRGERHLTDDQSLDAASFFNLDPLETEYFMSMVQKERAATHRLKNHYEEKLRKIREEALATKNRMKKDAELSDYLQSVYYSNWYYSAIRLSAMIPELNTAPAIAEHLKLPLSVVEQAVQFLIDANLLRRGKGQQLLPTKEHIFIDKHSPFVNRHHTNWRLKAIDNMTGINHEREMFFTCPMTLSKNVAYEIRQKFAAVIEEMMKKIQQPPDEIFYCLNIDWYQVKR